MKVNIVYWTGSGNTLMIADALYQGAEDGGHTVNSVYVNDMSAEDFAKADILCLGCPAMSGEDIEEYEFRPYYEDLKPYLEGKKVILFGSFDWGEGEWMQKWTAETKDVGADVIHSLAYQWTPEQEQLDEAYEIAKHL